MFKGSKQQCFYFPERKLCLLKRKSIVSVSCHNHMEHDILRHVNCHFNFLQAVYLLVLCSKLVCMKFHVMRCCTERKPKFGQKKCRYTARKMRHQKKIWNGMAQVFSSWMLAFTYHRDLKRLPPIFFHLLAPETAFRLVEILIQPISSMVFKANTPNQIDYTM